MAGCGHCGQAFDSVWTATTTLGVLFLPGDSWTVLATPLMLRSITAWLIFVPTYIVVNIGLLNIIAAVVVHTQVSAHEEDKKFMEELQSLGLLQSVGYLKDLFDGPDEASREYIHVIYNESEGFR